QVVREQLCRLGDRHATRWHRTGANGTATGRNLVGVALMHADLIEWDVELLGDELRVGRLVSLPVRLRTNPHIDRAVWRKLHTSALCRGTSAGFDIGRKPNAAQFSVLLRIGFALREAFPVGDILRAFHVANKLAGVVSPPCRGFIWHLLGGNEIPPPYIVLQFSRCTRDGVDEPLDYVGRFRPPRTTIGIDGGRMRVDATYT